MQIDSDELAAMVIYQLGALAGIARAVGAPHDAHELPWRAGQHGGRRCRRSPRPLWPPSRASTRADHRLLHQPSHRGRRGVLRPARRDDLPGRPRLRQAGLLVPRRLPGSVIHDEATVLERVRRVLQQRTVQRTREKTCRCVLTASCCMGTRLARCRLLARSAGKSSKPAGRSCPSPSWHSRAPAPQDKHAYRYKHKRSWRLPANFS